MRGDLRSQVVNPTLHPLPLDHPTRLGVPLRLGRVTFVSFCARCWDAIDIVKEGPNKPTSTSEPNTSGPTPTSATSSTNESVWDDQPTNTSQTSPKPTEHPKEGEVSISLPPSQEKNLYGLGSDDLTAMNSDEMELAMNPDEMELAFVAPWEKTVIPSAVDQLWSGYAEGQGEGSRKGENLWSDEPPPDPTAGQLMCPSHGKPCKKGICSEMRNL